MSIVNYILSNKAECLVALICSLLAVSTIYLLYRYLHR
jgi:hypothetical protein